MKRRRRIGVLLGLAVLTLVVAIAPSAEATGSAHSGGKPSPGVTPKTITIGVQWIDGGTSSVTGNNLAIGNPKAYAIAVANWINRHGGLGGRRVAIVLHSTNFANYVANRTAEQQSLCTDFTQDHHVFAALTTFASDVMLQCLASHNTIDIENFQSSLDASYYKKYASYYYNLGSMSLDDGAIDSVKSLAKQGFFAGGKIGIVYSDDPGATRAEAALKAALGQLHLTVTADAGISPSPAEESSTILRFQQSGIDRVLFVDSTGGLPFTFMNVAQSQHFNPQYGLNTTNNLAATAQIVPAAQLANSLAVSWSPDDVSSSSRLTPPKLPPTYVQCQGIFEAAGYSFPGPVAQYGALSYCGAFLFLQKVLKTASPTAAGVAKTVNALKSSFQAPNSYYTRFAKGRHFGSSRTRILAFSSTCNCFVYKALGGDY